MKDWTMPEAGGNSLTAAGKQPENETPHAPEPPEQTQAAGQTPPETLTQAAPEEAEPAKKPGAVPVFISLHEPPPQGVTPTEYSGLCCLLDRAGHYGGEGDVLFLCLHGGLLLARFLPAEEALCACGYLFRNAEIPDAVIWDRLPVLMGLLLAQEEPDQPLAPDDMMAAEPAVLKRFRRAEPALWDALRRMEKELALELQPQSIGFTRLPPEVYGDCGIRWYAVAPEREPQENAGEAPSDAALLKQYDADSDIYLTPPALLRGWRITKDGKRRRAYGLSDEIEWPKLQRLLEDLR